MMVTMTAQREVMAAAASMLFANNLRACSQACQADIMPLTSVLVVLVSQVFRATGGDDASAPKKIGRLAEEKVSRGPTHGVPSHARACK